MADLIERGEAVRIMLAYATPEDAEKASAAMLDIPARSPGVEELKRMMKVNAMLGRLGDFYKVVSQRDKARDDAALAMSLSHVMRRRAEVAEAQLGATRWQDMASAPKDGTTVLLHGLRHQPSIDAGTPETVIGYWTDYNGGGWLWHGTPSITFTHWMPLPLPPEEGP